MNCFPSFCVVSVVSDGLCCKLTQICSKPRSLLWAMERGKPDDFMTTKDTLQLVKKIGSGQFAEVYYGMFLLLFFSFFLLLLSNENMRFPYKYYVSL